MRRRSGPPVFAPEARRLLWRCLRPPGEQEQPDRQIRRHPERPQPRPPDKAPECAKQQKKAAAARADDRAHLSGPCRRQPLQQQARDHPPAVQRPDRQQIIKPQHQAVRREGRPAARGTPRRRSRFDKRPRQRRKAAPAGSQGRPPPDDRSANRSVSRRILSAAGQHRGHMRQLMQLPSRRGSAAPSRIPVERRQHDCKHTKARAAVQLPAPVRISNEPDSACCTASPFVQPLRQRGKRLHGPRLLCSTPQRARPPRRPPGHRS